MVQGRPDQGLGRSSQIGAGPDLEAGARLEWETEVGVRWDGSGWPVGGAR